MSASSITEYFEKSKSSTVSSTYWVLKMFIYIHIHIHTRIHIYTHIHTRTFCIYKTLHINIWNIYIAFIYIKHTSIYKLFALPLSMPCDTLILWYWNKSIQLTRPVSLSLKWNNVLLAEPNEKYGRNSSICLEHSGSLVNYLNLNIHIFSH